MATYTWIGGSGLWTDGADWSNGSTTGTAPGPGDDAIIPPGGPDEFFGVATAASLMSQSGLIFAGQASFGTIDRTFQGFEVRSGGSVVLGTATLDATADVSGSGSSLTVEGALILYGGSGVSVSDGGSVRVESLLANPGNSTATLCVDPAGTMEVGGGSIATAGTIALDAGADVALSYAVFATPVLDDATFVDQADVSFDAAVSGSGTIELSSFGTLSLAAAVASTVTIAFTGSGELLKLAATAPAIGATITGFGTGDVIDTGLLPARARAGDGIPQRAIVSSRPSGWFRTIGAG